MLGWLSRIKFIESDVSGILWERALGLCGNREQLALHASH